MVDKTGWTALHYSVALPMNLRLIKLVLSLLSETERLQVLSMQDQYGNTVLHCAAQSGKVIETILDLYPESERLQVLNMSNRSGETALHFVARLDKIECIKAVLSLYPESQWRQVLDKQDSYGRTALDIMREARNSVLEWLSKLERSVWKRHTSQQHSRDN